MMRVKDVQAYLKTLAQLMEKYGGKETAAELDSFCVGLEPFHKLGLNDFADILRREEVRAAAPVGVAARTRAKQPVDSEVVRKTLQEIQELYEQANKPNELRHEFIREEVKRWDKALNKEEGFEVSRSFLENDASYTSKIAALEAVGRKIADRLTLQKRFENLDRTGPAFNPPAEGDDSIPLGQA